LLSTLLLVACAADPLDPVGEAPAAHDDSPEAMAGAVPEAPLAQLVLTGRLADGREVTLAAAQGGRVAHAFLTVGGETLVADGAGEALRVDGLLGAGDLGFATVELAGTPRAIFSVAVRRHATPTGLRLWLEGEGTVGDEDVSVSGVAVVAPPAHEVLLAVSPETAPGAADGFALARLGGDGADTQVVLAEGVVGGELAPEITLGAVVAGDEVDAAPRLRRERVRVYAAGRDLPGSLTYQVECAQ
jgi:hypothetical protein